MLRLRRFLSGLFVTLLILAGVVWWGSSLLIGMNGAQIAQKLETELGPGFEVGEVSGNLAQGLIITGCTASPDPALPAAGGPVIQAAKCRVMPDWLSLLGPSPQIKSIVFSDVIVDLRRDAKGAILWPPFIARATQAQGATLTTGPFAWRLERAEIRFHGNPNAKPIVMQVPNAHGDYAPAALFRVAACQGQLGESSWTLNGSLALDETKTLVGTWRLKDAGLWEMTQALTGSSSTASIDSGVVPSGLVTGDLAIGGTLSDPEVAGLLHWRDGAIRHFKIEQGDLDLQWRPGIFTLSESVLKAYGGRIAVTGAVEFRGWPGRYSFDAKSESVELGTFLSDAGFGKLGLTGVFGGAFSGSGPLTDIGDFRGEGQVTARDGETRNPLADPQVPEIPDRVAYDSLSTQLTIGREMVQLDDLNMTAKDFSLTGQGRVTFGGELDLTGQLTAPAKMFKNHPIYGPTIVAFNLGETMVPLDLRVRGTLQTPRVTATVAGLPNSTSPTSSGLGGFIGKLKGLLGGGTQGE